jgi:rfaE bifunctional protein nucleotidyltransferase chain/domain
MIVNFEDLSRIREQHASETIVFMGGCFDLVHEGHVLGLTFSKSLADLLVTGVSRDERVRQRKGPSRPIRAEGSRITLVDALKPVDYSFLMPMPAENTPTIQVIQELQPDIFVDHRQNWQRWAGALAQIEALGTEVVFNDTPALDSTTHIIERVLKTS